MFFLGIRLEPPLAGTTINNSLESIGIEKAFEIDQELVSQTEWFDDEIIGTKHGDFFVKRSINYSKRTQSITSDDLF